MLQRAGPAAQLTRLLPIPVAILPCALTLDAPISATAVPDMQPRLAHLAVGVGATLGVGHIRDRREVLGVAAPAVRTARTTCAMLGVVASVVEHKADGDLAPVHLVRDPMEQLRASI